MIAFKNKILKFENSACIGIVLLCIGLLPANFSHAQTIDIEETQQAVELSETITGSGVQIINPVITCADSAIGKYNIQGVTNFPSGEGVVLSTGNIYDTRGPNTSQSTTTEWGTPGDPVITQVAQQINFDACVLEFDVVPVGDTLKFDFTFASEEYREYVGTPFNDVFGFFISGPGIAGDPGLNGLQNIALVPGTSQYVGINTVNNGNPDIGFPAVNPAYYVNNPLSFLNLIQYDGWTQNLYAQKVVNPCDTFHLKLVIADVGDREWDSSVFIEKIESNNVSLTTSTVGGISNMIEGCNDGTVTFTRNPVTDQEVVVTYFLEGTAINGTDYPLIGADPNPATPNFITIPANVASASISINPFADGISEGDETVKVYVGNPLCEGTVQDSITFIIQDSLNVQINPPLHYVCLGDSVQFNVSSQADSYAWSPSDFLNDPTIKEPTSAPLNDITYELSASLAGCTSVATVDVVVSDVQLTATPTPILCGGSNNGAIDLTITGGQTPISVAWSGPNGFSSSNVDLSNLEPGNYIALVTDREGCTANITVTITEVNALEVNLSSPTFIGGNNISCFQAADGQITATVTNGTPPYSFLWNDALAQTIQTATNLSVGTYTVTVTDANLCEQQQTLTITAPDPVTGDLVTRQNVLCNGDNTGSATIEGLGGNAPYTYLWNTIPPQSGVTATNLEAGVYSASITDINGCTGNIVVEIEEPLAAISGSVTTTNVLCNGDATGSATANITGGMPPYNYTWSPDGDVNNSTISNLAAGNYSLTVTDANDCEFVLPFNITEPTPIAINTVSQTNVDCNSNATGAVTVSASGGTSPYSYEWNTTPAQQGNALTGLEAGTYTVTATDANNCTAQLEIEITQPDPISIAVDSQVSPLCAASANGSIEVSASGGSLPYSYTWNTVPPVSGNTLSGITAGTYEVTVEDQNGCIETLSILLAAPEPLTISIDNTQNVLCTGDATGSATISVTGGTPDYSYDWNDPANQTTPTATNLSAGIYTVLVTDDNGCTASINVTINEPEFALSGSLISSTAIACFGDNTGSATVLGQGGSGSYSYSWNDPANQQTATASNLAAGTYTVTITDNNGCPTPFTLEVTIAGPTEALALTLTPSEYSGGVNLICANDSNATIDLTIAGGSAPYTILWDLPGLDTSTDQNLTDLAPGNYSVTITDSNGCVASASITLIAPSPIEIAYEVTPSLCFGSPTGTIDLTVSGGIPGYDILWSGPAGFTSTDLSLNTLEGGIYNLTITDANGCVYTDAVTVTQPEDLAITVDSLSDYNGFNLSCYNSNDGEIYIIPSGGTTPYSYQWNTAGNPNFSNQQNVINLAAGTYEAILFDANGCIQNSFIDLTAPDTLEIDFNLSLYPNGFNVSCAGASDGSIEAIPTGGTAPYTYTWIGSNGYGPISGNPIENLPQGEYSVFMQDAGGCSYFETVSINAPPPFSINLEAETINGNNISCNGASDGSINLIVNGGAAPVSISWTGPDGFTSSDEDLSGLPFGEYCVTVTDANDCEQLQCITLTQPDPLTIALDPTFYINGMNLNCDDSADGAILATITGGTTAYNFAWSGPDNFSSSSLNPTNLIEGTYCLQVTDLNGCSASECVTLTAPDPIEIILEDITVLGCDGDSDASIDVSISGGDPAFSYSWTGPNGFTASTEDIIGLEEGVYCLEVLDANLCTSERCFTISAPAPLSLTLLTSSFEGGFEIDCNGNANASIASAVSGGTAPFVYDWAGPDGFTSSLSSIENLTPGNYCLEITDFNNCTIQECVEITQPEVLTINEIITLPDCGEGALATIDLAISGGTAPYNLNWSNGASTETIQVTNGAYTVIVTDANGCSVSDVFTIELPSAITVVPTPSTGSAGFNIVCNGDNTGDIELEIFGGSGNFTTSWTGPNGFSSTSTDISGLEAGEYCVLVTDDLGCTGDTCITLTQPDLISMSFQSIQTSCSEAFDGSVSTIITGGVPTYNITWTGPNGFTANGTNISGLEPGEYCATVTDFNGCIISQCVDVLSPPALNIDLTSPETGGFNIECFGDNSGEVNSVVTGGTAPYTYQWTGPGGYASSDEQLVNLYAGEYCLTITDANLCTVNTCITLTENAGIDIALSVFEYPNGFNTTCGDICDGSLTTTLSGGAAPISVAWTGPNGFSSNQLSLSGLCGGVYSLTLTDNNGCERDTSFILTKPETISIDLDSPVFEGGNEIACFGENSGSILTTVTGGIGALTIQWTGPDGFTSSQANLQDLIAGTYNITVTDENMCSSSASIILTQPDEELTALATALTYPSGTNISCFGLEDGEISGTANGGTPPYQFNWTGPDGFTSNNQNIETLAAGTYTLVVEDANSCVFTINSILTEPEEALSAEAVIISEILCADENTGGIEVNTTGGSQDYTISWTGPDGFTSSNFAIENLAAGTYSYSVLDLNGCAENGSLTLTSPEPILISAEIVDANCQTATGIVNITVSNGLAPYTYLWSNNSTQQDLVNVASGTYTVQVTDANDCSVSETFVIGATNTLNIDVNITDLACFGDSTGMLSAVVITGQEPVVYSWTGPDGFTANTATLFDLIAGNYTLNATDANGCETNETFEVTQPQVLEIDPLTSPAFSNGYNLSDFQSGDGIIDEPDVTGGTPSYTYQWFSDNGYESASGNNQLNLQAGTYVLVVTDANMCVDSASIILTEPTLLEMPNGISPNGDGFNDFFTVRGLEDYPNNKLLVFNRWGNQVYEETNYRNSDPWNGSNQDGEELAEGTYFVVVELTGADNLKGYLEIRR